MRGVRHSDWRRRARVGVCSSRVNTLRLGKSINGGSRRSGSQMEQGVIMIQMIVRGKWLRFLRRGV